MGPFSSKDESSAERLEQLFDWLDPDRQRAGEKYEEIRQTLIQIFTWRRCSDPQGLADETFDRVLRKLPDLTEHYVGDPARYFYGVAKHILYEYYRSARRSSEIIEADEALESTIDQNDQRVIAEMRYECLNKCLQTLKPNDRELIMEYYRPTKSRSNLNKEMAAQLGLSSATLRIYVHKIRSNLRQCIEICMKSKKLPGQAELRDNK